MPTSSTFHLYVVPQGIDNAYCEDSVPTFGAALARLNDYKVMPSEIPEMADELMFEDTDILQIVGADGSILAAWSRENGDLDVTVFAKHGMGERMKPVIGYQIVNTDGFNIHGEEDDPFNLVSFAILTGAAVVTAREWTQLNPGFHVIPVYEGDIEDAEFVSHAEEPVDLRP